MLQALFAASSVYSGVEEAVDEHEVATKKGFIEAPPRKPAEEENGAEDFEKIDFKKIDLVQDIPLPIRHQRCKKTIKCNC